MYSLFLKNWLKFFGENRLKKGLLESFVLCEGTTNWEKLRWVQKWALLIWASWYKQAHVESEGKVSNVSISNYKVYFVCVSFDVQQSIKSINKKVVSATFSKKILFIDNFNGLIFHCFTVHIQLTLLFLLWAASFWCGNQQLFSRFQDFFYAFMLFFRFVSVTYRKME